MSSIESRINRIYNHIDEEQFAEAIQICRCPDLVVLPLVQALLAFCYSCSGEKVKALELANKVANLMPTDTSILETLAPTFRNCKAEDRIIDCYENALNLQPSNMAIAIELFFCFVKSGQHRRMQLTAQKAYKVTNRGMFLFWSVTSSLLQSELPPAMLLVAEKVLEKVFESKNTSDVTNAAEAGAEELELYINVLCRLKKFERAVSVLDNNVVMLSRIPKSGHGRIVCSYDLSIDDILNVEYDAIIDDSSEFELNGNLVKMEPLQALSKRSELLEKIYHELQATRESCAVEDILEYEFQLWLTHRIILQLHPDQWIAHEKIVDLIFFPHSSLSANVDGRISAHQSFLRDQQRIWPNLRGPRLAEILLLLRFANTCHRPELPIGWTANITESDFVGNEITSISPLQQEIYTLLRNYLSLFSSKSCCFNDIRCFMQLMATLRQTARISLIDDEFRFVLSSKANLDIKDPLCSVNSAWEGGYDILLLLHHWCKNEANVLVNQLENILSESESSIGDKVGEDFASEGKITFEELEKDLNLLAVQEKPSTNKSKKKNAKKAKRKQQQQQDLLQQRKIRVSTLITSICQLVRAELFCVKLITSSSARISSHCELIANIENRRHLTIPYLEKGKLAFTQESKNELLLLNSILIAFLNNARSKEEQFSMSEIFDAVLDLRDGAECPAIKLERLRLLRNLNLGNLCLQTFSTLGVRYIQNDSMSYIIIPALLESGLFREARKQHLMVVQYHGNARRDALAMTCKCFKHGNYAKALELNDFIDLCSKSLQLYYTRCELPLIELLLNHHSVETSRQHLQAGIGLSLGLPYLSDEIEEVELSNVKSTCDFSVFEDCESINNIFTNEMSRNMKVAWSLRQIALCIVSTSRPEEQQLEKAVNDVMAAIDVDSAVGYSLRVVCSVTLIWFKMATMSNHEMDLNFSESLNQLRKLENSFCSKCECTTASKSFRIGECRHTCINLSPTEHVCVLKPSYIHDLSKFTLYAVSILTLLCSRLHEMSPNYSSILVSSLLSLLGNVTSILELDEQHMSTAIDKRDYVTSLHERDLFVEELLVSQKFSIFSIRDILMMKSDALSSILK